jgi:chromate transporter
MNHLNLFLAFFRVGILGYGGGPSSIPLVHKEVVEKYKWIDDDDFADILALGNTLPGPIATKMAGYIGYRVAGWFGAINAVLSTIIPTIILMIFLLLFLTSNRELAWVNGMTNAVVPVVGVMLAVLTWDFFSKSKKGLGWKKAIGLTLFALIILEGINIHPAILIFALILFSLTKKEKNQQASDVKKGETT